MSTPAPDHPVPLDSASGEPLHPAAREVLDAALSRGWADPRRLHRSGRDARLLLDNARAVLAEALDCRSDEVVLCSSGTDAVHRGLLGLARSRRRHGTAIVCSAVEHSAVRHAARWLGEERAVGVDRHGRVNVDAFLAAGQAPGVAVAALQHANHEVGTVQPVEALEPLRAAGVPVLVDACASAGRLPLPADGWSALAASAHKWGGPAGVGVLVVRRSARWEQPFPGDARADHRETGFENVPAALAAAAALRAVLDERETEAARQRRLVDRVRAAAAALPDTEVVGDPDDRLPHLVTFSCLYVNGEAIVTELDRRGFGVASGSACTASTLEPSHVLAAMGALTHGNVRLSVGRDTTEADVEAFCAVLPEVVASLRADL